MDVEGLMAVIKNGEIKKIMNERNRIFISYYKIQCEDTKYYLIYKYLKIDETPEGKVITLNKYN